MISLDEFSKLDIRVGVVRSAERVPGTTKLLKLTVDLGEERTLVAGIAEHYTPEELVGKSIVILANLEPKVIRGIKSQGMLLAAEAGGSMALLTVDREVPPGTRAR